MRSQLAVAAALRGARWATAVPESARVVIVGGGVIGASTAYHLAGLGETDVVLLEQAQLTAGTTWHAAGLIGVSRGSSTMTSLCVYGSKLYEVLEDETGFSAGFKRCGSLTVARTQDRMLALERIAARNRAYGVEARMVSSQECGELWATGDGTPLLRTEDLAGGLWIPADGTASPGDLTQSLAAGAKKRGVKIIEKCRAEEFLTTVKDGKPQITGVRTQHGVINADVVILCAGQWSRQIAAELGVHVPLHSAEHLYITTKPIQGILHTLPVLRDPDAYIYMREWSGGLCVGGFEPEALPIWSGGAPTDFEFGLLPDNWDQFSVLYEGALERVPALETAEVRQMINGPESFTPDTAPVIGEAPNVKNLYVCAGFNSAGIATAGGAGKALSEWVVAGQPTMDLWEVDIRRFGAQFANVSFLRDRTAETLGLHYAMPWPRREMASVRGLRRTPLYTKLLEKGALFGQRAGWERVNYFQPDVNARTEREHEYSFGFPHWLELVNEEVNNTRNAVTLFDQTSFAKFLVQGRDALQVMNRLCTGQMDVPVGKITYNGMLNQYGGYETDVTVTRTGPNEFYIISPTAQAVRDKHWMESQILDTEAAVVTDVTSSYAVLSVMGPKSRELMQAVSTADFSAEGFPFGWSRTVDVGFNMVDAKRVTYVGELGWELHVATECAAAVYEALWAKGEALGLRDGGYFAIECMRLEKGYRAWGPDLAMDVTPIEAGLAFAVDYKKDDFNGKAALVKQKADGMKKRIVTVMVDAEVMLWGHEAIFLDGEVIGHCSSATWSPTLGRAVGLALVKHPQVGEKGWVKQQTWELMVDGKTYPATLQIGPAFDPKGTKVHA